jgi:hypothetical protein
VSRYDRVDWTTHTTEDGLADSIVETIIEDSDSNLWFGTRYGGVSRYDGVDWITYNTENTDSGLAANGVGAILEDSCGNLWFGTSGGGVSHYDGDNWTTFTQEDGLLDNWVKSILEDSDGNVWFGSTWGVSRYNGVDWWRRSMDAPGERIVAILEDSKGDLWFGSLGGWTGIPGGLTRFDGDSWTKYTTKNAGLVENSVGSIAEDSNGQLWLGTRAGVSLYDRVTWTTYTTEDGLAGDSVYAILEDSDCNIWVGTQDGLTLHEPDRVGPHTVIWPKPPRLSPNTIQTITFSAAFEEAGGLTFSHSFDGSDWSEWSSVNSWTASGLSDGEHVFRVKARDRFYNVDCTPGTCIFEVDATPPSPIITHPAFGEAVGGTLPISGTAADLRFSGYVLEARAAGSPSWDSIADSGSAVIDDILGIWDTEALADGDYHLRLSVTDTLGLTGTYLVLAVVDNEAPWAWETTPTLIKASAGGDVYTTNREVHLYFPPRALAADAVVRVRPAEESSVPDSLDVGAKLVLEGYDISWEGEQLKKAVTLEMVLDGSEGVKSPDEVLALYVLPEGDSEDWQRLGGTVSSSEEIISASINLEGTYSLFLDSGGPGPGGGLSAVSFTPRAFSPRGSFGSTEVAISFTLGQAGPVTVKVYNRAGRLIKELAGGTHMNAGSNVVPWDGYDEGGSIVPDGLYLVTVEALGDTQVNTLAVVR